MFGSCWTQPRWPSWPQRAAEVVGVTERVKVNARVDVKVREAFETAIRENRGQKRPYAGIELEREAFVELGRGPDAHRLAALGEVAGTLSEIDGNEKINLVSTGADGSGEIPVEPSTGETHKTQYRVAPEAKDGLKELAAASDRRSYGKFVQRLMWRYACGHGVDDRLADKIKSIAAAASTALDAATEGAKDDTNDDSERVRIVERRTTAVCRALDDEFTQEELEETIESVAGVHSDRSIGEYADRVYDRLHVVRKQRKGDGNDLYVPALAAMGADPDASMDNAALARAAELLGGMKPAAASEQVVENKLARAKHPEAVDGDLAKGVVHEAALANVDDADRWLTARVLRMYGHDAVADAVEPSDNDAADDEPAATGTPDGADDAGARAAQEADALLDRFAEAERVGEGGGA